MTHLRDLTPDTAPNRPLSQVRTQSQRVVFILHFPYSRLHMENLSRNDARWPTLDYSHWKDTLETLQRWVQIVGKIKLSKTPWVNHSWHATLYVTERGLTTSTIHDQEFSFSIEFDFIEHALAIRASNGSQIQLPLISESVSHFYSQCKSSLKRMGASFHIASQPNELFDTLSLKHDEIHQTYDPDAAHRFWQVLLRCDRLMKNFRSRFTGKVSPVHFFWGSFDLAVTRFSGRVAPEHPGGVPHLPDLVTREAYSHEVSSCGFWPGNALYPHAAFYSYSYPKPASFENATVPPEAFYHSGLKEFLLPYDLVRKAHLSDNLVLDFFERTYQAAADLGNWDRNSLEESKYLKILHSKAKNKFLKSAA